MDSVKVMIYLIEGVLPESYFANSLRGLSVDMAVFRDLLRIKLPVLSKHFDQLQCGDSKDCGTSCIFHPFLYLSSNFFYFVSLINRKKIFLLLKNFKMFKIKNICVFTELLLYIRKTIITTYHLNQRKQ